MPRVFPGYSEKITVSNTGISSANQKRFLARPGEYLHITNISFGLDSNMASNGSILAFIGNPSGGAGQIVVGDYDDGSPVGLVNSFSQDFPPPEELIVEPGQALIAQYAISTGSGKLQIVVTGQIYNTEEHFAWLARHGRRT